ncbi:hypothetical protein BVRB_009600 [Beta vulgaris subsp. vulgaris]|uniref:Protein SHORTAGE IN CHIASMATA 1 n=1 Tax=Beta vulgaris subsp. vulgaris TaxID=3555 RepID=A0A0J8B656_BETVV|nr:hypothetical protein BVRB_009600 [Beta vulgaris subsp. vulgaris]
MRTQFLTTDYFTTNQTLTFLRLPLSHHPSPPNSLSSSDELLRCCTDSSAIAVSLQLQKLPFEDALSKFYSDVLPHTIDTCSGDFPITEFQISEEDAVPCSEEKEAQSCPSFHPETLEIQFAEGRSEDTIGDKRDKEAVIIQFETPEMTQYLENVCMREKDEVQLLSELQDCDDDMEMLNRLCTDRYDLDINDHVNSVDVMCVDYDMTLKLHIPDEVDLLPNNIRLCSTTPPFLEIEEIAPEDIACLRLEDEWDSLFGSCEEQNSAHSVDLELCCQDMLVSVEIDILEHISDSHSSKLSLEFWFTSLNMAQDINLLQLIDTPSREKNTGLVDACPIPFADALLYEEVKMLDLDSYDIFEAHATWQTTEETDLCNMLHDIPLESFDELVVNCELAIIDGTFTSLPVPNLIDDEKIWSLHVIFDKIFNELEPVPLSTSDEIYLDWHVLGRDECNGDINAAIEKVFNDIEDYTMVSNVKSYDDSMLVLDLLLLDGPSDGLNTRENKVTMPSGVSSTVKYQNDKVTSVKTPEEDCQIIEIKNLTDAEIEKFASSKLSDDDCQIIETEGICDDDIHKLVSSVESIPQFNDLDFFLNPKKATAGMRSGQKVTPLDAKSMLCRGPHKKATAPSCSIHMQQSDIRLHMVILPANINVLVDKLHQSYLEILRDDLKLSKTEFPKLSFSDMNLLKLSEEKLMDHLNRSSVHKSFSGDVDDNTLNFVTLCAIKRMTWCLCFCGIYSLHLFVYELFQRLGSLKPRLSFLHSLIEDAYWVVDKDVTKSHPSLATIKEILLQNENIKRRVLIIAQRALWEPLKRLLASVDILFAELDLSMHDNQPDHLQTTCLLVPHEHISPSILVQEFEVIVEYGGPSGFSKVSTLYHEYIGSKNLHFLKVELDDVAKALCEGVIVTSNDRDTIKLEELLNFGPIKGKCNKISPEASSGTNTFDMPIHVSSTAQEFKPQKRCEVSFPDMIVIVNTQNVDKEMIISRRSTYQKILTIEKRGVQVVERDLILPVDIIINSTMCIVWYDCKNIGKKASSQDEGASSVPLCMENIAANVLTSLSFAFTTCILIFEGDINFLSPVMESADELYAAAASLGTYLQIFCSNSFELTEEIILNYIGHSGNMYKGLLSRVPESETLAESFLTMFPSINPLSAHAIITSGCVLLEFLELTAEGRVQILRKYHVLDESVNLFSALCKYGEREESKSGVTDCSSSVSSPPDSGNFIGRVKSENRKRKFVSGSCDAMYDFRCSIPSNNYVDGGLMDQGVLKPSKSKVSGSPSKCLQDKLPDFMLDDQLFRNGDAPDTTIYMDASTPWHETNITKAPKISQMKDDFVRSTLLVNDGFSSLQKSGSTVKNSREEKSMDIFQDLREDFAGEVVDIFDNSFFDGDFQVDGTTVKSSTMVSKTVKDHAPTYHRTARRLSFSSSSGPDIPMADAMDTSCGIEDNGQLRADNFFSGVEYNWSNIDFVAQEQREGTGRSILEKSMQNASDQLSEGKNVPSYGETPLSKAILSGQLRQGSPWTIEFLNRIKEKRRLRQQSQPCTSVPRTGYHGKVTKATKRRSPSILEYYKYQSNSTPRKLAEQKKDKKHAQLQNEKPSGFYPTWTPIDKRARRSLSYATNGTGSQTKLVWSDNTTCCQDRKFSGRV